MSENSGSTTNKRFIRWQGRTIKQLSTALALISGLAVGGLGLTLSLVREEDFQPAGRDAAIFLVGVVAFLIASAAGIGAVVTRLLDFRLTARKVRTGAVAEPLTLFGTDATCYGKATWRLFWTLLVSFVVAVMATVIVLSRLYLGRIVDAIAF